MKASSIVDNVINIKKDISQVNKKSDNSFNKLIDSETKNISNNYNNEKKYVSEEKVEESKTVFNKIDNIKKSEVKPEEVKEMLSEKLPKKLEKLISFLGSTDKEEITEEKLSELKNLIQNLIKTLKKVKEDDNPPLKEQLISDLKEINKKLKELFPDKDIKINLVNFKDNLLVDIKIDDKSLVFALDNKKFNIYKYIHKEDINNTQSTDKSKKNKNTKDLSNIVKDDKKIEDNSKTEENNIKNKTILSLVHDEKKSGENKSFENNDLAFLDNNEFNKNSLIKIEELIRNFIESKKNNSSQDKANNVKIKLSQMLVNKNDFIKLSKNISYFDLTDRIKSKTNQDNKKTKLITDETKLENKIEIKPLKNKKNNDKKLINDNFIEEKNDGDIEKNKNKQNDESKIKINNENVEINKNNKSINNESSNGNVKINPTNNNSTNIATNRISQSQAQTINLREFNSHIQEIVNQRTTENTFREIVTLKVNPPDLGNVDVEIAKNGKSISISIMTENENAKSFISRTIQALIGNLRDQGFNPINVKVETAPEPDLMDTEKQDEQNNDQDQQTEENNEEREFENILRGEENV